MTAAAELFAERGVDVPLDEIARRAGVSIGTLYNHFPNRGALLDAVLPDWGAEVDRLAGAALTDPDPWRGFAGFIDGLFALQAGNRSMNDAIARTPVGPVDIVAECGRTGGVLESVVNRARAAGVLRPDLGVVQSSVHETRALAPQRRGEAPLFESGSGKAAAGAVHYPKWGRWR